MTTNALFTVGAGNVIFDRFRRYLKPPAHNDWDAFVTGVDPTQNNLRRAFVAMFIHIFGDKAPRNLRLYIERT